MRLTLTLTEETTHACAALNNFCNKVVKHQNRDREFNPFLLLAMEKGKKGLIHFLAFWIALSLGGVCIYTFATTLTAAIPGDQCLPAISNEILEIESDADE